MPARAAAPAAIAATAAARRVCVRGVVQGVGFRPFIHRLAHRHGLAGWVLNSGAGVEIHVEGAAAALADFVRDLGARPPAAARISSLEVSAAPAEGCRGFAIRASVSGRLPTTRISPDLPVCDACLAELFAPHDRRHGYPYINCTDCGPRFSLILGLPYDRPATTMRGWPLCADCAREYHDPADRRFHAQPVACPRCGPHLRLEAGDETLEITLAESVAAGRVRLMGREAEGAAAREAPPDEIVGPGGAHEISDDAAVVRAAAGLLAAGRIVAVKGLGGYHLACGARDGAAVAALRRRKFRKEKPFAVMARDLETARGLIDLSPAAEALLCSAARPIVLAPARVELPGVAPGNRELGVMLPYTPLHHLLFAAGAPAELVMTSANRSSEPIAYRDDEARQHLAGIADAFLVGERPIARRVDDSVVRAGVLGPAVLRRARGHAPSAVARLPAARPILALGADLKSAVTLVVGGEAFVSQHIGDLEHFEAHRAFREVIADLTGMYRLEMAELVVAHDLHPEYRSTACARELPAARRIACQHHRAHVASVLAERGELTRRVAGIALDGTGYGDDGAIWGGEIFTGSVRAGFTRAVHLRSAALPGGDAAARHPVQAAAGFLAGLDGLPDLAAAPFSFPPLYRQARMLVEKGLRTFPTTSAGRLFDTVAALLGFTREITFEGQAAIWLEQLAGGGPAAPAAPGAGAGAPEPYPLPLAGGELDHRPLLAAVAADRAAGRPVKEIAWAFHRGLAHGFGGAALALCREQELTAVVVSGGVLQNELLCAELQSVLRPSGIALWAQRQVPCNDGGISLGQAAIAASVLAADGS
jgi:hydrogenase maturation protein HypF